MERLLGRYEIYFYAILRIVTGFLFVWHGTQKWLGFPPPAPNTCPCPVPPPPPSDLMAILTPIAGGIELIGGTLIIVGLFTRVSAFIASGMVAVAYFMVHQPMGALPITNRGELAALYCFVFLYIAARGSGVWSIDSMFRGPRASETS
jgi:putative oxidoreductase